MLYFFFFFYLFLFSCVQPIRLFTTPPMSPIHSSFYSIFTMHIYIFTLTFHLIFKLKFIHYIHILTSFSQRSFFTICCFEAFFSSCITSSGVRSVTPSSPFFVLNYLSSRFFFPENYSRIKILFCFERTYCQHQRCQEFFSR